MLKVLTKTNVVTHLIKNVLKNRACIHTIKKNHDETWQGKRNTNLRVEASITLFREQINAFLMQIQCLITKA